MEKVARTIVFFLVVAAVAHAQSGPTIDSLSPSAGTPGATVTINGSGFGVSQGSSTVAFNGTNAAATSWSDGQITVTVPAGASNGSVSITVAGQFSNPVSFTVVQPPQITSLSPASGSVGTSITIAGSNFGTTQGGSSVSFNGVLATPSSWSSISIVVPVPNSATTGNVVVNVSVPGTNGTVASNGLTFTLAPHITSLSPTSGVVGASVTISGSSFGATQGSSTVAFNGIASTPTNWNATSITAPVPSGAATGNVVVKVGGTNSNGINFAVVPHITSLSPTSGASGTSVTISGSGFGAAQGSNTVTFNGVAATPGSWSASSIVVPVPSGAGSGNVVVTVGGQASNGVAFAVVPHITGLSPTSGASGTSVTISGSGFGAAQGSSTVTFNGVAATPGSWSASSIVVPVPSGAGSGNVVVTVSGLASNGVAFTVSLTPQITGLSPASGAIGVPVTISGNNFGATQGSSTVTFNGVAATPSSWSATSIVVPVPSGASTGNVVLTVGGLASNGVLFTVGPQITGLSPVSGAVGSTVTVNGNNFGVTQGSSTIVFNGKTAVPKSWSNTQIVATVPVGATTGNVVVTVSGLNSNTLQFTVTLGIASIAPTTGTAGTVVTVTGIGFGATQGTSTVTFNGTIATPTSWSDTQIVVPAPNGATTGSVAVTIGGVASSGPAFQVSPSLTITCDLGCPGTGTYGTKVTFKITALNLDPVAQPGILVVDDSHAKDTGGGTQVDEILCNGLTLSNGSALCTPSHALAVISGGHEISATYNFSGSGNFISTKPSAQWTVTPNDTTVTVSSSNPNSKNLQPVIFTATVTPVNPIDASAQPPTGSVDLRDTFNNQTTTLATLPVGANGVTTFPMNTTLAVGTHSIVAAYTPNNANYMAGDNTKNPLTQTVSFAPVIASLTPPTGPAGMGFTINGINFGASPGTVTFAGSVLPVANGNWSDTAISVQVPPNAAVGSAPIVVTPVAQAGQAVQPSDPVTFTVRNRFDPCTP